MALLKLVIADDEKTARQSLKRAFSQKYSILEAENGQKALDIIQAENPDLVLLDLNMPKLGGFQVLEKVRKMENPPICIMMTAYGSERVAVDALKMGAWNYIAKPFQLDEVRTLLRNVSAQICLKRENLQLRTKISQSKTTLLGHSVKMDQIRELIHKVSATNATVLLTGESGTGKELAARSIHDQSDRRNKPFIALNCGALPKDLIESELFGYKKGAFTGAVLDKKGKFELAHGGTLFLDEIGNMEPDTQIKVLRAIDEKCVTPLGAEQPMPTDVRIVSATNSDLKKSIAEQNFREDLYYRLCVVELNMPPLRYHKENIPMLLQFFIDEYCIQHNKGKMSLSKNLIKIAHNYSWPGNVRELRNVVENAVVLSGKKLDESIIINRISTDTSSNFQLNGRSFQQAKQDYLEPIEISLVREALEKAKNNITRAAEILGMKRQYLQQKMKQLNLKV